MTREERLELLKQIEKDIYVPSIESTFLDDAKSCAIHSAIEELEQEPCDYISRQAVIEITAETGALETQARVKALPPVTPKPKTGYWINGKCSECEKEGLLESTGEYVCDTFVYRIAHSKYCPNCGTKMEVE